jgi:hypothetical protein
LAEWYGSMNNCRHSLFIMLDMLCLVPIDLDRF